MSYVLMSSALSLINSIIARILCINNKKKIFEPSVANITQIPVFDSRTLCMAFAFIKIRALDYQLSTINYNNCNNKNKNNNNKQ